MKINLISFYFLFGITVFFNSEIYAQRVPKLSVIETITNSRCGVCAFRVPRMQQNLSPFEGEFISLTYFAPFPYSNCPFHQLNPPLYNSRISYYSPSGTPTVYVNGLRFSQGDSIIPQQFMRDLIEETASVNMELQMRNTDTVQITIHNIDETEGAAKQLLLWVVQQEIIGGPLANYQRHINVVLDAPLGYQGVTVTMPAQGESVQINVQILPQVIINAGTHAVVAYLQNTNNSTINQAAIVAIEEPNRTQTASVNEKKLEIFPNPSNDYITIKQPDINLGESNIEIITIDGKLMQKSTLSTGTINIKDLPNGNYILRLTSGREIWNGKFIKTDQ
jgi:hypothetical protein